MSTLGRRLAALWGCTVAGWLIFSTVPSSGVEPVADPQFADTQIAARTVLHLPATAPPDATHVYTGSLSCAAAACHGGDATRIKKSEFTIWARQPREGGAKADPHRKSYQVLFNERSQTIAKNLGYDNAHTAKVCLNCHALQIPSDSFNPASHAIISDSVSCESCHGPAGDWLDVHKQAGWKFMTPEEKATYGFQDTKDLLSRARMCADCHVGGKDRDVNHDIMAAGHPRLNFEFSAFFDNLPAHWDQRAERSRHPIGNKGTSDYEAKMWAIGQVVTAEKSVELLAMRAEGAPDANHEPRVWPEFTEYGCFACHHDLSANAPGTPPVWRQARGWEDRLPGVTYPWGTWQFAVLPALADDIGGMDFNAEEGAFQTLQKTMRSSSSPDRQVVAEQARRLHAELAAWAERVNQMEYDPEQLHRLLTKLTGEADELTKQEWDAAAQVYLAVAAIHLGYRERTSGIERQPSPSELKVVDELQMVRDKLKYPFAYESPQTYNNISLEEIQQALGRIHEELGSTK